MKLADYVLSRLADLGLEQVFLVTGGGAMHLDDAIRKEPRLRWLCNHHEQASAMAAEGYARIAGKPAVLCVTTGPGGINALNGVFGAFTDSIPMVVLSGQVKRETCMATSGAQRLRQLGDQETDILAMVRGITKYAAMIRDPDDVRHHVEKAVALATAGRPGPVWLDIPVDVQGAEIVPDALRGWDGDLESPATDTAGLAASCADVLSRLARAERPVLLGGTGVRLAGAETLFVQTAERLGIPLTTAWTHDLVASDHPLFAGRPGTIGTRAGNFAVQNADLLLVVGSRLNVRQTGYAFRAFAPHATIVHVDVDPAELSKPTLRPHVPVVADARRFLHELLRQAGAPGAPRGDHGAWVAWCQERRRRYPPVVARQRTAEHGVNPYWFVETLFELLRDDDVVVCANGAACVMTFQAAHLRRGQRLFSNSGSASMGYDLPAAIGAVVARGGGRVVCLAGDGSVQMNLQELQTIAHHRLPVKLFVLDNGGYLSIRTTQRNFFGGFIGEGPASGVSFPDPLRIAAAYGLPGLRAEGPTFRAAVDEALRSAGPVLTHVILDPSQAMEPRPSSRPRPDGTIVSAPLHDLFPFLERNELLDNLVGPLRAEALGATPTTQGGHG